MKIDLYQRVSLSQDFPDYRLVRGDVAMLIDYVPHPEGKEDGCVLEVFNALGESIATVAVPQSAVEPLRSDEVIAVRSIC
jgi:hypothetical protein